MQSSSILNPKSKIQNYFPLLWSVILLLASSAGLPALAQQLPPADFGDAPAPYPTLLKDDGARHLIVSGFHLGAIIDAEPDGQPDPEALGDDFAAEGDEDGVTFNTPLMAGQTAQLDVFLTGKQGRLNAWVDFNRDGDWLDEGEQIFRDQLLVTGKNSLSFPVPAGVSPGPTFARFRLNSQGSLKPNGFASDGEVEDYAVALQPRQQEQVDLSVHKLDSPDPVVVGDTLTYSIIVSNNSTVTATGVNLADTLPAGVNFISATATQGSCVFSAGTVVCNLGTLGPQTSVTVTIKVTPTAPGVLSNQAKVASKEPDSNLANNVSAARTTVISPTPTDCIVRSNKGTDFWVAFPGNYALNPEDKVQLTLCIVGPPESSGEVTIPGLRFSESFVITGTMLAKVTLPSGAELTDDTDSIQPKGIHIVSKQEVAVFGLSHIPYSTDGFVALPTDVLGTEYTIQAYKNVLTGIPELNGTQFAVLATEDQTKVTITPAAATATHAAGAAFDIVLNKGEAYQLRSHANAPADLTGSSVVADKAIAVFSGHSCAFINSPSLLFCDYIVEEQLPVQSAGTSFLAIPLEDRFQGDTFRFLAVEDGTTVSVNGGAVANLNRGAWHEMVLKTAARISSDKPIFVSQFANSSDFDDVMNADPFMITLPHEAQFLNQYMLCTPDGPFVHHFLNVIAPTAAVGGIILDGNPIPAASFSPIPTSAYSGAKVKVNPGAHNLSGNSAFAVIAYGFGLYDSYGYPGGLAFGDSVPPVLTCPTNHITVNVQQSSTAGVPLHGAAVPDLRSGVKVFDNCVLPRLVIISQDPAPGTFVSLGKHDIVLSARDARGNLGSCTVVFEVINSSPIQTVQIQLTSNTQLQVSWSQGQVLESAPAVTGPWTSVPNAVSPFTDTLKDRQKFYRVK